MKEYLDLVKSTIEEGSYEERRTRVDTISQVGLSYKISLSEGYPLLTTKDMTGFRWNSMIHELIWFLSGQSHIREFKEKSKIWNEWADDEFNLESAYGRFWRRFPVPEEGMKLEGEAWITRESEYTNEIDGNVTFDQLRYIVDALKGENPHRSPKSRRLVLSAWHPSNASVSNLPPCHFSAIFNIQNDELNLVLNQRSGDIALGVPFNIASYCALLKLVSNETGHDLGFFTHNIADAHIYCGTDNRSSWYDDNLERLQKKVKSTDAEYASIARFVEDTAPDEKEEDVGKDHIPNLLRQMDRQPLGRSRLDISDSATIDNVSYDDFELKSYNSHDGLSFSIAE